MNLHCGVTWALHPATFLGSVRLTLAWYVANEQSQVDKCCKIVGHNLYFLGQARYCARARGKGTKIKWVRFGRPKSSPLIDPFYDGNWKAELGMTTKIVPGKPLARFGSRKRELSAAEPCAAEIAYQELVEPGCQFFINDPEYGGLCADYSALSDNEGLSTTSAKFKF